MTTVARFLAACAAQVGTVEHPAGSNCQPYSGELHRPCEWWCLDFLNAIAKRTALRLPPGVASTAYTPAAVTAFQAAKRWSLKPALGAWAFWDFVDDVHRVQHVSGVAGWTARSVTTFDGNTIPQGGSGDDANGGGVFQRTRPRAWVVGYGLPYYDTAPLPPKAKPLPTQALEVNVICAPDWLATHADGRVPFYELRPIDATKFVVVAFNSAPLLHQSGTTPSGFPYMEVKPTTGAALGIDAHGTSVIVACANGGTYEVARKP